MAESPTPPSSPEISPTPAPVRGRMGGDTYALVALSIAALVCITLLAVALALLLRGNNQPALSNVGNVTMQAPAAPAVAAPAAPAVPSGIQRPHEPAKPQSERASAMDRTQPALPGVVATPTPPGGQRKIALNRADPASPPSPPPVPTVDAKRAAFRQRADPNSQYGGQKPLPMPVRYSAEVKGAKADPDRFSYAPDVPFAESGVRGVSLDLQLSAPKMSSAVDGYRALKGFQFFSGKLHIANKGAQPVVLRLEDLEVHDADGVLYLVNNELVIGKLPEPSLAAGAEADIELSFLVPEASPLKELAVMEAPGQAALLPLQAR